VLVPLALGAMLLAGCGGGIDPSLAAIVNGQEIPISTLEARLDVLRENPQAAAQLENDPDGTLLAQAENELLNDLIQTVLLEQGARDELTIEVTEEDVQEQREEVIEQVGGEEAFDELVEQNNLSEEEIGTQLRRLSLTEQVTEALGQEIEITDAEVEEYYEQNQARYGPTAIARHILTEDEDTAQQAMDRLENGEDFADVAEDVSTDPGSAQQGGELGPLTQGQTVPEFDEAVFSAPVGEVVGPIETDFGFHILEVTEREEEGQPLEEVEGEIRQELAQGQQATLVQTFLQERAQEADVEVNPRFGEWDGEAGRVVQGDPLGTLETPPPADEGPPGAEPGDVEAPGDAPDS
jgi:parvulin-like peptidyl-prolyl isomerase